MESSFDARSRFVLLWIAAAAWFPLVMVAATPAIVAGGDGYVVLQAAGLLSWPIAALCQWPLLRGRVPQAWLWPIVAVGASLLYHVAAAPLGGLLFPERGGAMAVWMLYFAAAGLLNGLAAGTAQSVAIGIWRLGPLAWVAVVAGASLLAACVSGVLWHLADLSESPAPPATVNLLLLASVALREVIFGGIVGLWLYGRLAQRSVDAARPAA